MNIYDKFNNVCRFVAKNHGFEADGIYCLVTGKEIGRSFEVENLIESLSGDIETIGDEVAMRVLASMKPSIIWNRLRETDLNDMRKSAPIETMCYLLNRLLIPPKESKLYLDQLTLNKHRIHLFAALHAVFNESHQEAFDSAMLMLLELEAKLSLVSEESPFGYSDIINDESPFESLVALLLPWHSKRIAYFVRAESEAKFFASNPGARRAYASAWMQVAPKAESTIKREAVQKTKNFMSAMLDELMGTGADKPAAMRPTETQMAVPASQPKLATKMPMKFGVK